MSLPYVFDFVDNRWRRRGASAAEQLSYHRTARTRPVARLVSCVRPNTKARPLELETYVLELARALGLSGHVCGVQYPGNAIEAIERSGLAFSGHVSNHHVPEVFSRHLVTVHVPRRTCLVARMRANFATQPRPAWKWRKSSVKQIELTSPRPRPRSRCPVIERRAAVERWRDRAFVSDHGPSVGLRTATRFNRACEHVETRHAVQLVGVSERGGIERASQHRDRFVIERSGTGNGWPSLPPCAKANRAGSSNRYCRCAPSVGWCGRGHHHQGSCGLRSRAARQASSVNGAPDRRRCTRRAPAISD